MTTSRKILFTTAATLASIALSQDCSKYICAKEAEYPDFKHSDHWNCGIVKKVGAVTETHLKPCRKGIENNIHDICVSTGKWTSV